jgi:hypothetical protein
MKTWDEMVLSSRRFRNFRSFFAGFRETDGNGLPAALYLSAFAALAGTKCAVLSAPHCAFDGFSSCFTVSAATRSLSRTLPGWHGSPPAP